MRTSYQAVLDVGEEDLTMSPGKMLVVAFDGLFSRLTADQRHLVELIRTTQPPVVWKKIDVIKEAKSLQVSDHLELCVINCRVLHGYYWQVFL